MIYWPCYRESGCILANAKAHVQHPFHLVGRCTPKALHTLLCMLSQVHNIHRHCCTLVLQILFECARILRRMWFVSPTDHTLCLCLLLGPFYFSNTPIYFHSCTSKNRFIKPATRQVSLKTNPRSHFYSSCLWGSPHTHTHLSRQSHLSDWHRYTARKSSGITVRNQRSNAIYGPPRPPERRLFEDRLSLQPRTQIS